MGINLEAAIFKNAEIIFQKRDQWSEWLVIKAEFLFLDRIIVTTLTGKTVSGLVTALLGHEPKAWLADSLFKYRSAPVGVCWKKASDEPSQMQLLSFFHVTEADIVDIREKYSKKSAKKRLK